MIEIRVMDGPVWVAQRLGGVYGAQSTVDELGEKACFWGLMPNAGALYEWDGGEVAVKRQNVICCFPTYRFLGWVYRDHEAPPHRRYIPQRIRALDRWKRETLNNFGFLDKL